MRCTWLIGLNKYAKDCLDKHEIIEIKPMRLCGGICDEDVIGHEYHLKPKYKNYPSANEKIIAKEKVFDSPWCSGPMIFTYLEVWLVKKNPQEDDDKEVKWGDFFQWILDPSLEDEHIEYDTETGRYYV